MSRPYPSGWLVLAALVLVGAASAGDPLDLVRAGNAAFARGDFKEAAALYQQAEALTTDPGLVAFNKATALYNRGKYEEAETHFWLCLGDASPLITDRLKESPVRKLSPSLQASAGPRLARVLYNVGNCALQRSQGTDPELLEQAVMAFDQCLKLKGLSAALGADARYNLALARDLARLHPRQTARPDNSDKGTDKNKPPPEKENPGSEQGDAGSEKKTDGEGDKNKPDPRDRSRSGDEKDADRSKRMAGKGNLAALPDDDKLARLSAEDAAAHMYQEVRRIRSDQRRESRPQDTRRSSGNVLDW